MFSKCTSNENKTNDIFEVIVDLSEAFKQKGMSIIQNHFTHRKLNELAGKRAMNDLVNVIEVRSRYLSNYFLRFLKQNGKFMSQAN
jgi:hypothetical protein